MTHWTVQVQHPEIGKYTVPFRFESEAYAFIRQQKIYYRRQLGINDVNFHKTTVRN